MSKYTIQFFNCYVDQTSNLNFKLMVGRDHHTTNVQSVWYINETMSPLTTVRKHLIGSIIHSGPARNRKEMYGSFDYYKYPHESNLTEQFLLDTLVKVSEEFDLPPIVYLQLNNYVRENKNQHMFALLTLLVEEMIFKKLIHISHWALCSTLKIS